MASKRSRESARKECARMLRDEADLIESETELEGAVSTSSESEAWNRIIPIIQGVIALIRWLRGSEEKGAST